MLNCKEFYSILEQHGVGFSSGVPDSLLKYLCSYIADHGNDIIAANEGASISIATGHHLATGNIPMVYLQNSGFGNLINPLTSLTDPEVYSIPMLILMGWRGEPGVKDEPQHIKQGRITVPMLETLEIPFDFLSKEIEQAKNQIDIAFDYMKREQAPYALLIRKDTFEPYELQHRVVDKSYPMKRERALEVLLAQLTEKDIIVSTTGKTSREVFEIRTRNKQTHSADFLTVGSMGHSSQIALGIALAKPDRRVFCLDGDGALLMHMGSAAINGNMNCKNFYHILINNGSHESVGGQPTVGFETDFQQMLQACGYKKTFCVEKEEELIAGIQSLLQVEGPALLEIKSAVGSRENLGRPTIKPVDNKINFMKNLKN